jgi:hypothetical protein
MKKSAVHSTESVRTIRRKRTSDMVEYVNECVDCGKPCLGDACPYRKVPHYYCDKCDDETTIYHFDGRELCISCIEQLLENVE